MATHRKHALAVDALQELKNEFVGNLFPTRYAHHGISICGQSRITEFALAGALSTAYGEIAEIEPGGDNTFPDVAVQLINYRTIIAEAKSFIRKDSGQNQWGLTSKKLLFADPLQTAAYLKAHFFIWDININGTVNEIHHKTFADIANLKYVEDDPYFNWQEAKSGPRMRPQNGWETRVRSNTTILKALSDEDPDFAREVDRIMSSPLLYKR